LRGYGKILDLDGKDPNLTVSEISQEHGVVRTRFRDGFAKDSAIAP
jgi:hypothetical protein